MSSTLQHVTSVNRALMNDNLSQYHVQYLTPIPIIFPNRMQTSNSINANTFPIVSSQACFVQNVLFE